MCHDGERVPEGRAGTAPAGCSGASPFEQAHSPPDWASAATAIAKVTTRKIQFAAVTACVTLRWRQTPTVRAEQHGACAWAALERVLAT